jgi:uncharacterized repeat protein (TIGR02543 family)
MKCSFKIQFMTLVFLCMSIFCVNAQTYTLQVNVSGPGSPNPTGGNYTKGSVATITATPVPGSNFLGWTGSITSSSNPVSITMNSNMTITANFGPFPKLIILANPSGAGTFTPSSGNTYTAGMGVNVTATPAFGYRFVNWSGAVSSSANPVTVTTGYSDMTITANFTELPKHTLTTAVTTSGTGTISPASGSTYYEGQQVPVTATPALGYSFSGWSGAASGTTNPVTITMDADKTITATFTPTPNVWQINDTKIYYNGGNVGIGTTSPGANLSFGNLNDGRNSPDGITWYSPSPLTYGIYRTSGAWTAPNYQQLKFSWDTGIIIDGGSVYGKSGIVLQPSGGNVLIGKTSQTNTVYKLDVGGKVRANEVIVNTTGADFVFEPTYKLRSLAEVEAFIKANKHLPEVAPATDMQANGVNVNELQTTLLQKVEELTLYVIEQEKKNAILEQKLTIQNTKYLQLLKAIEELKIK